MLEVEGIQSFGLLLRLLNLVYLLSAMCHITLKNDSGPCLNVEILKSVTSFWVATGVLDMVWTVLFRLVVLECG